MVLLSLQIDHFLQFNNHTRLMCELTWPTNIRLHFRIIRARFLRVLCKTQR